MTLRAWRDSPGPPLGQPPSDADRAPHSDEVAAQAAGALSPGAAFSSLFEPDPLLAVTVDVQDVDFGACSRLRLSEYKAGGWSLEQDIETKYSIDVVFRPSESARLHKHARMVSRALILVRVPALHYPVLVLNDPTARW
jgi:hypothetical protein